MFKNKKFEVKVLKDSPEPAQTAKPKEPFVTQDELFRGAALLIGTYFAGDTIRGIITHVVVTKVK